MQCVKCYGKAKFATVDSSFKRKFFESIASKTSVGSNSFQEFQQKGSSSCISVSSFSDYTNRHSGELFISKDYSLGESLPVFSPRSSRNARRKRKSVKHFVSSKTGVLKKFPHASAAKFSDDLLTNKAKKRSNKHARTSKSSVRQRISKQFKLPVGPTALRSSHSDLMLSYAKGRSKDRRGLQLNKKGVLKRKPKISHNRSLNKHSSIPIQPSCSKFCESPLSVINAGVKKINKKVGLKKQQLTNKVQHAATSKCFDTDMVPSFDSKHDSFWAAIQPRWSSIYEYSFEIEKASKERKAIPVFSEQHANKNTRFSDLNSKENEGLSSKEIISNRILFQSEGSSNCKHPLAVKMVESPHGFYHPEKDSFTEQGIDLNITSSKYAGCKFSADQDISENDIVCEKSAAIICTDLVNDQPFPEIENIEIQYTNDKIPLVVSDVCETLSEKLNANEIVAVNGNISKAEGKNIKTFKEEIRSKYNEDFMSVSQTDFIVNKPISEMRNKENLGLSKNVGQLQDYATSVSSKKSNGFYSSTPFASPSTRDTVVKFGPSIGAFSPVFQKGLFITSTPSFKTQQNQMYNISRISYSMKKSNSLQNLSFDPFNKVPRCSNSPSVLSRRNKNTPISTQQPHRSRSLRSTRNTRDSTSQSCVSVSTRKQLAIEEPGCSKRKSLSDEESSSSGTSTSDESDIQSALSKLLKFCGQTRIIPFIELYDWSRTTIRKIGEGTYGEVFTIVQNKISSVVKVIPFSEENVDHDMQSIENVLSEVTVSKCLSELRNNETNRTRNFNKLKSVHLVQGCYPNQMLAAWDKFSESKSTYNSRPDIFNDEQMFAIIELEYGGKDMSDFLLRNAVEAESVLKQIAISLAIAEEVHLFEHRDLHLGNILVQRNTSKTISYIFGGETFSIPNHGLVVTIIDFTFSRVLNEGCIFYNDLADENSLFNQTGDYQFQIYKDTKFHLNNEWHKCMLYSNVLWLTYLCVKLLEYEYSRPSSKKHEEGLNNIRTFQNNLNNCQTAFESVTTCKILSSVPKKQQDSAKKMAIKAKFIDRKSMSHHISNNN